LINHPLVPRSARSSMRRRSPGKILSYCSVSVIAWKDARYEDA
jgi:hypothetical protein